MNVININLPEFADVPKTLDGEVLLERTRDAHGNVTGYITVTVEVYEAMKLRTPEERAAMGWGNYDLR